MKKKVTRLSMIEISRAPACGARDSVEAFFAGLMMKSDFGLVRGLRQYVNFLHLLYDWLRMISTICIEQSWMICTTHLVCVKYCG